MGMSMIGTMLPLLLNVAIVILVIVFIYKKISFRSDRKHIEMQQIKERLEKLERDIEELKTILRKDER